MIIKSIIYSFCVFKLLHILCGTYTVRLLISSAERIQGFIADSLCYNCDRVIRLQKLPAEFHPLHIAVYNQADPKTTREAGVNIEFIILEAIFEICKAHQNSVIIVNTSLYRTGYLLINIY